LVCLKPPLLLQNTSTRLSQAAAAAALPAAAAALPAADLQRFLPLL
jgi:hypothetical protein